MKPLLGILAALGTLFIECTGGEEASPTPQGTRIELTEDSTSLLRNPAMGWGIYEELGRKRLSADSYWIQQNGVARKYASFLYIRWMWSDIEPEEGRYAWLYDSQYKKLIEGALARGLKLCFCIYYNSQDCAQQAVPDYVRLAGAEGYLSTGQGGQQYWSPYPDDPVFQQKLEQFLGAFAAEYDNPDLVDFVDGTNLGWWGECHHIELKDKSKLNAVFEWITATYARAFQKVILVHPFGSEFGYQQEKLIAVDRNGFALRRNGLGSQWYGADQQKITDQMVGTIPFFGEGCWWGGNSQTTYFPFLNDPAYALKTWRDVYQLTCKQALAGHFNTLDLRNPTESRGWTLDAPDLIQQFIAEGGYRLYPRYFELPRTIETQSTATIRHSWGNKATGYCPNNLPNWNHKYKVAFAVIDAQGEVLRIFVDTKADPGDWIKGRWFDYEFTFDTGGLPAGNYHWGVAIADTGKENMPGIRLSVKEPPELNGWTGLAEFTVR